MKLRRHFVIYGLVIALVAALLTWHSPPVRSQNGTSPRIESDDGTVTRIGTWTSQTASQASGGSYLYSGGAETDVLSLQFSGPSIEVLYVAGPSLGIWAIEVDGTVLRTVITTADETAYQQSSRIDYLSDEPHTLKVYAQAGGIVAIDAFVVPPLPPAPLATNNEGEASGETRVPFCAPTNVIHRVSLTSTGGQASESSVYPELSADGRHIVFQSWASLVPSDEDAVLDIYAYDRATCTLELLSVASSGQKGNADSLGVYLSGDGRYVAYSSYATNLVADDTNSVLDVFVRDRITSTTSRVSVATGGGQALGGDSYMDGITPDGRYIVFTSDSNNLVADDFNNTSDVFVHDRQTGITSRASLADDDMEISNSFNGVISADGRYVAFVSNDNTVVSNDTNGRNLEIFVRDRQDETTTRVSVATGGIQTATGSANTPFISSDGRYVAFYSGSSDLVSGDTNGLNDVFVHDRNTATTTRISVTSDGTQAIGGDSLYPRMSYDGRYTAFLSRATNLVAGTVNGNAYGYVHDQQSGITSLVSLGEIGSQFTTASPRPILSGDGQFITFTSDVATLVSNDTNNAYDIFVTPRFPGASNLAATALDDGRIQLNWTDNPSDETEYRIERSPDGLNNWVEIGTAPADTTTYTNVSLICNTTYHYRVRAYRASDATYSAYSNVANATTAACPASCNSSDVIQLVSRANDGSQGNAYSEIGSSSSAYALSDDGRYVVFSSEASNLVPGDTNGVRDSFLVDRQTCQIWRISLASNGTQANSATWKANISGNGRYIGFVSAATNLLMVTDPYAYDDAFVHDRETGQTRLVSGLGTDAAPIFDNYGTNQPSVSLSDDGRYIAFISGGNNLVPGDTNNQTSEDAFVRDMQTGVITRVSVLSNGGQSDGGFRKPFISGDGRYVTFHGDSALVPNDIYPGTDVYVYDRQTNLPYLASVATGGIHNASSAGSYDPAISDDGRFIVFWSHSTQLVPGDTNNQRDVFLHDRLLNQTIRVSQSVTGQQGNGDSIYPSISADGRYITFGSWANTLGSIVPNGNPYIYLWDRLTQGISLVSAAADGTPGNQGDVISSISSDGRFAAFASGSTNLVASDTNGVSDIFVVNLETRLARPHTLAIVNPATRSANLVHTLTNPPTGGDYTQFATGLPFGTGGQYLTGDWNGDGLETLGVYRGGAFFFTNDYGTGGTWGGVWFGLSGQPVAGRFDTNANHDCLGVTDSGAWTNGDLYFALYFTCNLTGGATPPLTFQWLSIILPNSQGFTGTYQFVAGDFDGDGLDSIAIRRGNFIAWTNVPPTTVYSAFQYAQYIGAPGTGDEGKIVVGDWDLNNTDSFGLVYQNGTFYRRNDLDWNSGAYTLQQFTPLVGTPFDVASWRPH